MVGRRAREKKNTIKRITFRLEEGFLGWHGAGGRGKKPTNDPHSSSAASFSTQLRRRRWLNDFEIVVPNATLAAFSWLREGSSIEIFLVFVFTVYRESHNTSGGAYRACVFFTNHKVHVPRDFCAQTSDGDDFSARRCFGRTTRAKA